jgi:hypothetical protein
MSVGLSSAALPAHFAGGGGAARVNCLACTTIPTTNSAMKSRTDIVWSRVTFWAMTVAPVSVESKMMAQSKSARTRIAPITPPRRNAIQASDSYCNLKASAWRTKPPAIKPAIPTNNRCKKIESRAPSKPAPNAITTVSSSDFPPSHSVANRLPTIKPTPATNSQKRRRPNSKRRTPTSILKSHIAFILTGSGRQARVSMQLIWPRVFVEISRCSLFASDGRVD